MKIGYKVVLNRSGVPTSCNAKKSLLKEKG